MNQKKSITRSLQIPDDTWEFVNQLAKENERSLSYIVRHILDDFKKSGGKIKNNTYITKGDNDV